MRVQGKVKEVSVYPTKDFLVTAALLDDETIYLDDVADFDEEGGLLNIEDDIYEYSGKDEETNALFLSPETPILADLEVETEVFLYPPSEEKRAMVEIPDDPGWKESIIPYGMQGQFEDGVRDPEEEETVYINDDKGHWEIDEVVGQPALIDGADIREGTLPDDSTPTEAPISSPAITVSGMPSGFVVSTENVHPSTEIEYHVSTVENFTTDETTLSVTTKATVYVVPNLPDGSSFVPNQIYYFKVVAKNVVGSAPPSAEVSSSLNMDAIETVIAAQIISGFILTGRIQIGQIYIDANEGIVIPSPAGETILPADGSGSTFRGEGTFDALTVLGNLNIRGLTNFVQGLITLATGVPNPGQQPVIATQYDAVSTPEGDDGGFYRKGLVETDDEWGWVEAPTWAEYSHMQFISKIGGNWAFRNFDSLVGWQALGGATKIGTRYFLLSRQKSNPSNWRILVHAADGETGRTHGEYIGSMDSNGAGLGSISAAAYPTIGKDDSGNLLVAWVTASGNAYIRKMAAIGGAAVSLTSLGMSWSTSAHMFGVQQVGSRYFVATNTSIYSFNAAGGARTTADEFPSANNLLAGIWHDGTVWHTFNFGFIVYHYTNNQGTYDFAYTWYDSDAGGSGTAESLPSPIKTTAPKKFAQWRFTIPAMPPDDGTTDGANTARLYAAPTGDPLIIQGQLPEGTTGIIYEAFNTSGSGPPLVSGFATRLSTALGRIESAATDGLGALIKFLGTGEWRLGDLSGDASGNVSGVADITHPGDVTWTNITPETGFAHVSGDPGQFRVKNSTVYFRGRMRRTSTTNTFVGNIGVAIARPQSQVNGMIRCGNDWIPWVIGVSGNLIISSAVTTGQDIHVASAAGIPYLNS